MSESVPLPPPFGVPSGPSWASEQLLEHYVAGAQAGSSPDARIERAVLMSRGEVDQPVAIHLGAAVLLRDAELPDVAALRSALEQALHAAGMVLIERDATLAGVVGIEFTGLRGEAWSLWARDAEEGHAALAQQAAGEVADMLDHDDARRRAEVDAALDEIERQL